MSLVDEKRARRSTRNEDSAGRNTTTSRYHDAPEVIVTDSHDSFPSLPNVVQPELGAEAEVPPAYSEHHDQLSFHQSGFDAGAVVTDDGRVNINLNQTSRLVARSLRDQIKEDARTAAESPLPPAYIPPSLGGQPGQIPPPRLNIVIQIVGSRGDVQPFIALGKVLKDTYGHRVRVATHPVFEKFVEENDLEFFSIGGDPAELMAFMVKNPGLMPGFDALKNGEITKRRKGIEEIILGCWRSCIETGKGLGPAPSFSKLDRDPAGVDVRDSHDPLHKPFVADAIIANPPSFAHIHVAEKLGVPLHLMFTMPWSPTKAFPQPLANIQSTNTDLATTNYISYALVELMTWQGLGDVINRFRTKILDLEPLPLLWAPAVITRLRIPYTYCWSPALIPKPADWGSHIDVAGFYFLNLASSYTPEPELAAFLESGPPPVYIGFGSIVVDDPNKLTRMIFDAVAETGVRALVSKGWGGLGADDVGIPDGVFMLGNVPHDWLFSHVSAVCHHGGAGTTAAGIKAGKPTIIVPFFGDQPFWGSMVARAGAGPDPIPYAKLTAEGLAEAIRVATKPETQERAQELGAKIREELGTDVGAQSFHRHLNVDNLRCSIVPSRTAVWRVRRSQTLLSALAAATLVQLGYLQYSDLKLFRMKEYSTDDHPTDPISAVTSALVGDFASIGLSVADFPRDVFKAARGKQKPQEETTADDDTVLSNKAEISSTTAATISTTTTNTSAESPGGALVNPRLARADTDPTNIPRRSTLGRENEATDGTALPLPSDSQHHPDDAVPAQRRRTTTNPEPPRPPQSPPPSGTTSPPQLHDNLERAMMAGKSVNNIVQTGMRSPMHFCMGLAKGFRNLPKLYNDDTVRPPEKVTGLSSGLKIAGKEFGLGFYDGISGLVTQPYRGAQKEGAIGLVKGFGKGIGGLALKPASAIWSIPAYAMAGVDAEIRTFFANNAHNYIIASRISQGNEDYKQSNQGERDDIEVRWLARKPQLKAFYAMKQKQKGKSRDASPGSPERRDTPQQETRRTLWRHGRGTSTDDSRNPLRRAHSDTPTTSSSYRSEQSVRVATPDATQAQDEEFEQAIQTAVRQTSTGDPVEDAQIEHAIRESILAVRHRSGPSNLSGTASSSGPTSVPGISRRPTPPQLPPRTSTDLQDLDDITDEEYQSLIEQAVQLSVMEHERQVALARRRYSTDSENDEDFQRVLQRSQTDHTVSSNEQDDQEYQRVLKASQTEYAKSMAKSGDPQDEDDEDEALRKAIEASQSEQGRAGSEDQDQELRRAIEESERVHREEMAKKEISKTEEEIVMEYVKRQSLAEQQFRLAASGKEWKQGEGSGSGKETDEDLKAKAALAHARQPSPKSRKSG